MADKKASAPKFSLNGYELAFLGIFTFGLFKVLYDWAIGYKDNVMSFYDSVLFFLVNIFAKYVVFSIFISLVFIILIIVYIYKQNVMLDKIVQKVILNGGEKETKLKDVILENKKWKLVQEHINSNDANKWKLAILEADIILSDLLESLKLPGESIGEKLKSVEVSDFDNIEQAWEAHKIRNAIAHQGSEFLITQNEAKRVIGLFEKVFKEFNVI